VALTEAVESGKLDKTLEIIDTGKIDFRIEERSNSSSNNNKATAQVQLKWRQ